MWQVNVQRIVWLICAVSVFLLAVFSVFTADDSFILLRYVENFIHYGELTFNLTEKVSALTSPLHAVIMIVVGALTGSYILHAEKILMSVLLFASVYLVAKNYRNQPLVYILPFEAILLSPFILMWTVGGLETPILLFVITWLCHESMKPASAKQLYKLCFIGGLAFITRYDSIIFTAPFLLVYFLINFKRLGKVSVASLSALLYALFPVLWFAFSLHYYHDVFPTSYYLKLNRVLDLYTIIYCFQFYIYSGFLPFWFLGFTILIFSSRWQFLRNHFIDNAHIYTALFCITLYGFMNAQVHMMFGYRLLVPFIAPFIFVVLELWKEFFSSQETKAFFVRYIYVSLMILFISAQFWHSWYFYYKSINGLTLSGEYQKIGIKAYKHNFLQAMEDGAADIAKHIATQPKFRHRQATFHTFAEGVIPYNLPGLYTYGPLVSLRKNEERDFYDLPENSDYIYAISFKADSILPFQKRYQVISRRKVNYLSQETTFFIFYNPNPELIQLPKYIRNKPSDLFAEFQYQ